MFLLLTSFLLNSCKLVFFLIETALICFLFNYVKSEEFVPSTRAYLLTPKENYYSSTQPFSYLPNAIVYQQSPTSYSIPDQDSFYFTPSTSTYSSPSTTFIPQSTNFPFQSIGSPPTSPLTALKQHVIPTQFYRNPPVQNDKKANYIQYEQPYYTDHVPETYTLPTPALDTLPTYAVSTQPTPIHVTLIPYETLISLPLKNNGYTYDKKSGYHGSSFYQKKKMRNSKRQIESWLLNTELSPLVNNQNMVPRQTVALSPMFNLTA
jgi:hypothetical protein